VKSDLSLLKSGDCRLVVRMRTAPGTSIQMRKSTDVTADWSCECARHLEIVHDLEPGAK
jgi:hypothetical protein